MSRVVRALVAVVAAAAAVAGGDPEVPVGAELELAAVVVVGVGVADLDHRAGATRVRARPASRAERLVLDRRRVVAAGAGVEDVEAAVRPHRRGSNAIESRPASLEGSARPEAHALGEVEERRGRASRLVAHARSRSPRCSTTKSVLAARRAAWVDVGRAASKLSRSVAARTPGPRAGGRRAASRRASRVAASAAAAAASTRPTPSCRPACRPAQLRLSRPATQPVDGPVERDRVDVPGGVLAERAQRSGPRGRARGRRRRGSRPASAVKLRSSPCAEVAVQVAAVERGELGVADDVAAGDRAAAPSRPYSSTGAIAPGASWSSLKRSRALERRPAEVRRPPAASLGGTASISSSASWPTSPIQRSPVVAVEREAPRVAQAERGDLVARRRRVVGRRSAGACRAGSSGSWARALRIAGRRRRRRCRCRAAVGAEQQQAAVVVAAKSSIRSSSRALAGIGDARGRRPSARTRPCARRRRCR